MHLLAALRKFQPWILVILVLAVCTVDTVTDLLDPYLRLVLIYVAVNIVLTVSLNLVNGYMGEFSVGHAGFMAVGAYTSSVLTVLLLPPSLGQVGFFLALLVGGMAAASTGLLIAVPSFKTRGDYLAIVTLAFNMIVKSGVENIEAVGGPRGFLGMPQYTNLLWAYGWVVLTLVVMRNLLSSSYGRGVVAIREDEIAAELMGVNTRRCKVLAFAISAFFAGVAGGLFAHTLQYIHPTTFSIIKSTDILVMLYLGGMGSLAGSIIGGALYTIVLEALRDLGIWRMVVSPLLLIILMLFRPRGIMGGREWGILLAPGGSTGAPAKGKGEDVAAA